MTTPADLWELPQPRSTSAITDKTETNFYSRCPPEKRPRYMKEMKIHELNVSPTISETSSLSPKKQTTGDAEIEKQSNEPHMEKVCRSRLASYQHEI